MNQQESHQVVEGLTPYPSGLAQVKPGGWVGPERTAGSQWWPQPGKAAPETVSGALPTALRYRRRTEAETAGKDLGSAKGELSSK